MLNEHDQQRLENMYPDGIPEELESLLERVQRRRHANGLGTGPSASETLLLVTFLVEQQQRIDELETLINERAYLKREAPPVAQEPGQQETQQEESRLDMPEIPMKDGKVMWNRVQEGTRVMCKSGDRELLGRFRVAMRGKFHGKLKIDIDDSSAEFDTFSEEDVRIVPE